MPPLYKVLTLLRMASSIQNWLKKRNGTFRDQRVKMRILNAVGSEQKEPELIDLSRRTSGVDFHQTSLPNEEVKTDQLNQGTSEIIQRKTYPKALKIQAVEIAER